MPAETRLVTHSAEETEAAGERLGRTLDAGDPATIVLLSPQPRVLLNNAPVSADTLDRLLAGQRTTPAPLNLEAGLETIHEMLDAMTLATRECYIITDAQAGTWSGGTI